MSAAHNRARALEKKTATLLGTTRTNHRSRYQSAPDMAAVTLPSGARVQPEAKKRATIPAYVREGLDQCRKYDAGAIPLVVIEQTRGEPIACLPLRAFVQLVGIVPLEPANATTLPLPSGATRTLVDTAEEGGGQ